MKKILIILLLPILTLGYGSISSAASSGSVEVKETNNNKELNRFFVKYKVKGSILIFDKKNKRYLSNNFAHAQTGFIPASTFKIPNTLIGLETGVIKSDTLFYWDGKKRQQLACERDLTLKQAFTFSCVSVYQDLAREIGFKRMQKYLNDLDFGEMVVTPNTIDTFWLEGNSKISQYQQIHFLERLYDYTLPASIENMKTVKAIMRYENSEDYQLSGKTGWAVRNGQNYGWFVGYIQKGTDDVFFFATHIEPINNAGPEQIGIARIQLTKDILTYLKIITPSTAASKANVLAK